MAEYGLLAAETSFPDARCPCQTGQIERMQRSRLQSSGERRLTFGLVEDGSIALDLEIMTNRRIRPTFSREVVMQYYKSNRRLPLLVRGFAVLCAALAMAAAGSASAAPTETVLHSFTGRDGSIPSGGVIVWHDANWRCGELGMQRVRMRRGVQALAGRDRDGAAL